MRRWEKAAPSSARSAAPITPASGGVTAKDGPPSRQFKLSKDDPGTLLAALSSDNLLWRQHAQRLLVDRGNTDVAPQLRAAVANRSVDAAGVNGGALHALWTLHLLGADDAEDSQAALSASCGGRAARRGRYYAPHGGGRSHACLMRICFMIRTSACGFMPCSP